MRPYDTVRQKTIFDVLDRFPDAGNMTLAKKIYNENPTLFKNIEEARDRIRYFRGVKGVENRSHLSSKKYVRQPVPTT